MPVDEKLLLKREQLPSVLYDSEGKAHFSLQLPPIHHDTLMRGFDPHYIRDRLLEEVVEVTRAELEELYIVLGEVTMPEIVDIRKLIQKADESDDRVYIPGFPFTSGLTIKNMELDRGELDSHLKMIVASTEPRKLFVPEEVGLPGQLVQEYGLKLANPEPGYLCFTCPSHIETQGLTNPAVVLFKNLLIAYNNAVVEWIHSD
ncbi:hypothetical protein ACFL2V_18805 [Pseudomonadota bacterium]